MPEFLTLLPPQEALKRLLDYSPRIQDVEDVPTPEALHRVLGKDIRAPHPLPQFPRSTVDGYAVKAQDTFGASESLPAYLQLVGEVPMGEEPKIHLNAGECALIHTGGMIPPGSDAVVMLEYTQSSRPEEVEILKAVAVGENVIRVGEDVKQGEVVIPAGTRLRPAEIGGLMALGYVSVSVYKRPRVGIISSGDEVIPPAQTPRLGEVRDVNAYTLGALVQQAGGDVLQLGIVGDSMEEMNAAVSEAKQKCDVVVITAGSSASARDITATVIDSMGKPGVLVHGVNIRPGKPTILAVCDGVPMIGLPGNPVSALVNSYVFIEPLIKHMLGEIKRGPVPVVKAKLSINLSSQAGREDWVPVTIVQRDGEYWAEPVFGRSNLIFTLARAVGLFRIPPDATGLSVGQWVDVMYMS